MRTITAGMQSHLNLEVTTLTDCWWIRRMDGVQLYFTNHDQDLTIGGQVYKSCWAEDPNAVDVKLDMSVNNTEISGFFLAGGITIADLAGRIYDKARVNIFRQNWADPTMTGVTLMSGYVGDITRHGEVCKLEFRSLTQALALNLCSLYADKCRSLFGATGTGTASGCRYPVDPDVWLATTAYESNLAYRVHVAPSTHNGYDYRCTTGGVSGGSEPTWPVTVGGTVVDGGITWTAVPAITRTGSVLTATNRRVFTITGVLGPFQAGAAATVVLPCYVRFTSGDNDGVKREIGALSLSGSDWIVTLIEPMPFDVAVSDDVQIIASCDRTDVQCKAYGNFDNMRAEIKLPGSDYLFKVYPSGG